MASSTVVLRKCMSASGLNQAVRQQFSRMVDTRRQASSDFTLTDTAMAALAMFQFKSPSLLQFDKSTRNSEDNVLIDNLKRLIDRHQRRALRVPSANVATITTYASSSPGIADLT